MVLEQPRMGVRDTGTKKELLAEGVFHLVGERIVRGELAPGDRIRDAELARELSVSRTPVREALQRLERIGLVKMYPSRFTEVTRLTPDAVHMAHEFAGLQAGVITRLACPRLAQDEIDAVVRLVERVPSTVDDAAACSQARREVIGYLSARSGNRLQQALVDEASMALARALRGFVVTPEHREALLRGCDEMPRTLRDRDADAAEHATRLIYGVA